MNTAFQRFFLQVAPYIWFAFVLLIGIVGLILLSYLLIWGALIGVILFAVLYIKQKFFTKKQQTPHRPEGKVYDQDDFKN